MKAGFIKTGLIKPITFMEQAQRHGGDEKGLGNNENNSFFSTLNYKNLFA